MSGPSGRPSRREALLVLADGEIFEGEAIGADPKGGIATGELVFNTVLSGYQEVLTDPSYAGQIVTFTYPHIGNYGTNPDDDEAHRPRVRGMVVRDLADQPSNWRSAESLEDFLLRHHVPGISGVDTRRLTRHLRAAGAMPCAFGTAPERDLRAAAMAAEGTDGRDLVAEVTTGSSYVRGEGARRVVAYDFGIKETILRHLSGFSTVTVVPAATTADDVLALEPDGVFLSNGPGDPEPVDYAVRSIRQMMGRVPVFGICLGHQLCGLALGGRTYKLKFGHHGGNHPVRNNATGKVEITAHNHNFAVDPDSINANEVELTHVDLNDQTLEGLRHKTLPLFSVQYHPEAAPGPHDSHYLFRDFRQMMEEWKG